MLQPRKVKYRKQQKGRNKGIAQNGHTIVFGKYALQAISRGRVTSRQIEAGRIAIVRHARRGAKIWIRIFPDKPITSKPAETRMGKGKGAVEYWVSNVKPGKIIYEIDGVSEEVALECLRRAGHKMPVLCKVIKLEDEV